jgi:hypothetical protein
MRYEEPLHAIIFVELNGLIQRNKITYQGI